MLLSPGLSADLATREGMRSSRHKSVGTPLRSEGQREEGPRACPAPPSEPSSEPCELDGPTSEPLSEPCELNGEDEMLDEKGDTG